MAARQRKRTATRSDKQPERRLLLSRSQLASAFGVVPLRITRWASDGMPVADRGSRGRESRYDLQAVNAWWLDRELRARGVGRAAGQPIDLARERAKLARAQTARTMLDVGAKQRDLLPVDDVRQAFGSCVHAIRSALLAMPQALAEQCLAAAPGGAPAIEALLKASVHDTLRSLAQWPGALLPGDDEAA